MLEYAAIVTVVAEATKTIVAWAKDLAALLQSGSQAKAGVMHAAQRRRLAVLLGALQNQRYSQAPLPWLLRLTARKRDTGNWVRIAELLARLQIQVVEVLEILQDEAGPVTFECRDAFEAALFGIRDRQLLFQFSHSYHLRSPKQTLTRWSNSLLIMPT